MLFPPPAGNSFEFNVTDLQRKKPSFQNRPIATPPAADTDKNSQSEEATAAHANEGINEGIKVTLSIPGLAKQKGEANLDGGLPDNIKKLKERIGELKEKIKELDEKINKLKSQQPLSEAQQQQLELLQDEMVNLQNALTDTTAQLAQALKES